MYFINLYTYITIYPTNRKVSGSNPAGVIGNFIDIKSFRSHNGSGIDSVSNRNEYQENFLEGKGGRLLRLTNLPTSCAVVIKSENPNFLEPSVPLQVCNGSALPLPLLFISRSEMPSLKICLTLNPSFLRPRPLTDNPCFTCNYKLLVI